MPQSFVHLRVHSEFSLTDGIVRLKPMAAALADMHIPAVAVTDNNNLFGLIKFYNAAQSKGIKPLVGTDVWLRPDGLESEPTPLVLIASSDLGYKNLKELISRAYQHGQIQGRILLAREWLAEQSEGLIALSAGREGDVGRAILAGKLEQAKDRLKRWMQIFPDAYYLELQRTNRPDEAAYIHGAVNIALASDCPVVATNDVRFLQREEFEAHEVRVCINAGRVLDDPSRPRLYSEEQYLKTPTEMTALFSDIPEAIENSLEIARRCNVNIDLGNYYLPDYPVPIGETTESYFCRVSKEGLDVRLKTILDPHQDDYQAQRKRYFNRLELELGIINRMGFPGYFLIVMEFIQWAKDNDIPVGPGRGSGAGSLVAYVLLITDVDPIAYDLLFERFLNPERVSLPDFDIDFCMDGRDAVIQHVMDQYGRNAVSQIITFGTMAAKAVVRDVARVQGKPYGLADKLAKLIPFDPGITLAKAMEEEALLKAFVNTDEQAGEIMEMAFKLEGITRNVSRHAGGVVIAPTKISDFSPVYCDESGGLMTQFDKDDVEKAGLIKFDFLGLRTLTIIDKAVKSINKRNATRGAKLIKIHAVPLDDPLIYQDFRAAKTTAVFQLESRGMKTLMQKVQPNRFGDIVALVALFRPGPLQLAPDFISRKAGREEVDYLHPSLQHILEGTYGVMLYQEQVMQIAQTLAGYSLADADLLRRAMGKKKPAEMAKQRDGFLKGAVAKGVAEKQADHIFSLMEKFAGYGFNKPHSVAYAWIAYQTAWLKHYYPADFMAAVLSSDMQTTDKILINTEECRTMGIDISSPDANYGNFRFVASAHKSIVYGLGSIKGLGEGLVNKLVECRKQGGMFKDLYDLCERLGAHKINRRAIETLIGSGALDDLVAFDGQTVKQQHIDYKRALLIANQEDAVQVAAQKARNEDSGLMDMFGEDLLSLPDSGTRYAYFDIVKSLTIQQRLNLEKNTLGYYLTGHPMDYYAKEIAQLTTSKIDRLQVSRSDQVVSGLVMDIYTKKNDQGEARFSIVRLSDTSGHIDILVSSALFKTHHGQLQKDAIIFCKGSTRKDDLNGGIVMRAKEIYDLLQARERYAKTLRVTLVGAKLKQNFADQLAALLTQHRGQSGADCAVSIAYFHPQQVQGTVHLGSGWRVSPSDDLLQSLRDQYGEECVALEY